MRSIRLMAATSVILAAAWACGDGGTDVTTLAANFTPPSCTVGTPCAFTDASTPVGGISSWAWNFGDGNATPADNTSNLQNPSHTYSVAGTYDVQLTVTDASAASNSKTSQVTVTAGTGNQPPTASFTLPTACNAGTPCGFHSTSTDPDGDIALATFAWDFGDQGTANTADATHTYQNPGTYTVTLTVTDAAGAASTPASQQLTVAAATSQGCTTSGTLVNCSVDITQAGRVRLILTSSNCELGNNKLTITAPVAQTVFSNMCFLADNTEYIVKDAGGADKQFTVGERLTVQFRQGTPDPGDPATGDPGIRVQGSLPNLTLNIDDGGAAGTQGEPDFNDAVVLIQSGL